MELFRKQDSGFYWYDFKVRGKRYRGSTKETNRRGLEGLPLCGSHNLLQVPWSTGRLPACRISTWFLDWVESAALAAQTRKYYANGWRLLSSRTIAGMRLDHIARDIVEPCVSAVQQRTRTVHYERCAGCSTREKSGISSSRFQNSSCGRSRGAH